MRRTSLILLAVLLSWTAASPARAGDVSPAVIKSFKTSDAPTRILWNCHVSLSLNAPLWGYIRAAAGSNCPPGAVQFKYRIFFSSQRTGAPAWQQGGDISASSPYLNATPSSQWTIKPWRLWWWATMDWSITGTSRRGFLAVPAWQSP